MDNASGLMVLNLPNCMHVARTDASRALVNVVDKLCWSHDYELIFARGYTLCVLASGMVDAIVSD